MPQPKKSSASGSSRRKSTGTGRAASSARKPAARTAGAKKAAPKRAAPKKAGAKKAAPKSRSTASSAAKKPAARRAPSRTSRAKRRAAPSASAATRRTVSAAQQADAAGVASGLAALRDALTSRAADSLSLVMLTRERLQEAFDEAVERGHITRESANSITQDLVRRSRREASDILADLEQLAGRSRSGLEAAGKKVRTSSAADRALQQVDRARRTVGVGPNFPVLGYDDLNAAQITERLDGLTPAELRKVRDFERRHGNRKSVLAAIEKQLA